MRFTTYLAQHKAQDHNAVHGRHIEKKPAHGAAARQAV